MAKLAYSAIKNKAKPKELYSTLKPATNSASYFKKYLYIIVRTNLIRQLIQVLSNKVFI